MSYPHDLFRCEGYDRWNTDHGLRRQADFRRDCERIWAQDPANAPELIKAQYKEAVSTEDYARYKAYRDSQQAARAQPRSRPEYRHTRASPPRATPREQEDELQRALCASKAEHKTAASRASSSSECRACGSARISIIIEPCMHACLCDLCAAGARTCPICQNAIIGRTRLALG